MLAYVPVCFYQSVAVIGLFGGLGVCLLMNLGDWILSTQEKDTVRINISIVVLCSWVLLVVKIIILLSTVGFKF